MRKESECEVFEVREGKKVCWPEDKDGWTYETVCLGCPDGWTRRYRARPQAGVQVSRYAAGNQRLDNKPLLPAFSSSTSVEPLDPLS